MTFDSSEIIIYQTDDGQTRIDVRMEEETVWLSQAQMAELFQTTKQNVSLHINNAFAEGELEPSATVKEYLTVQNEGGRDVSRNIKYYNLDVIISVGYRVKSLRGTQFRRWALGVLKEYLKKGFAMNDDLLKRAGGGNYWQELLERIRDIRSSEKIFYRQMLDLYATSVDYDPRTPESIEFFKIVQNKIHFAAHGHTATEVISERANAELPFGPDGLFQRTSEKERNWGRQELPDQRGTRPAEPHGIRILRPCGASGDAAPADVYARLDC